MATLIHACMPGPIEYSIPRGSSTAVVSPASELILNPTAIVSQMTVSTRTSGQWSAYTMPAAVATPLQPANR